MDTKKKSKATPLSPEQMAKIPKTSEKELKKLPSIKKVVAELESKGITAAKIAKKLNDGLEATKPVVADGEILNYSPDFPTRYKYCELLLKVRGDMVVSNGNERGDVNIQVNLVDLSDRIQLLSVKKEDNRGV